LIDKHTPPSSSSPHSSSVAELTDILNENEKNIKNLITNKFKNDKTSIFEV
jgi:hypothetical protein